MKINLIYHSPSERNTETVVAVTTTSVVVEVEGTSIRRIAIVATTMEPRVTRVHKVRICFQPNPYLIFPP